MQDGDLCPLLRKKCARSKCKFWIHLRGKDPQSEREIDTHDCAISWLPVLLIENAQMSRQAGAAVESFRNEMVRQGQHVLTARNNGELTHESDHNS